MVNIKKDTKCVGCLYSKTSSSRGWFRCIHPLDETNKLHRKCDGRFDK